MVCAGAGEGEAEVEDKAHGDGELAAAFEPLVQAADSPVRSVPLFTLDIALTSEDCMNCTSKHPLPTIRFSDLRNIYTGQYLVVNIVSPRRAQGTA